MDMTTNILLILSIIVLCSGCGLLGYFIGKKRTVTGMNRIFNRFLTDLRSAGFIRLTYPESDTKIDLETWSKMANEAIGYDFFVCSR